MAVSQRGRTREPSLLVRYGAQFAQLLEQKTAEAALHEAQQEAQRNADNVLLAIGEAQFANEQLKDEKQRLLQAQSRLDYIATHDALTELPNRSLFNEKLNEAVGSAAARGGAFALFYIDLDHFQDVNETFGHETGDMLLKEVAKRLLSSVGPQDVVARLGSDEFVILQSEANGTEAAKELADRLIAVIGAPLILSGYAIAAAASIGITMFPRDGVDPASLHRNADLAMHRCKNEGRNGYHFFNALLDEAVHRRTFLEKALRDALQNGEMSLVYQPQTSLITRKITGVEALLRWHSAECGRVAPDEFIPIAERCGLIAELGAWVLRESCMQAVRWDAAGLPQSLTMAVNVSVPQLRLSNLPDIVENVLLETGFPPSRLVLEITETEIMRDMPTSVQTLTRLRALGIKVAIDDFGTGYSSLSYLRRLPVDKIKIDKSFVTDVTINGDAATIVSTIVTLARNLRLTAVAEGVETNEQEQFLREIGCHYGQGYFYGKPGPSADFVSRFVAEPVTT